MLILGLIIENISSSSSLLRPLLYLLWAPLIFLSSIGFDVVELCRR